MRDNALKEARSGDLNVGVRSVRHQYGRSRDNCNCFLRERGFGGVAYVCRDGGRSSLHL